jgi:hypothetical protein
MMSEKRSAHGYMLTVITLGFLCLVASVIYLPLARADIYLPILAVLTVVIGSRVTIKIPRFKSHIALSDTFIFLTLLIYGGEYAIILSALEAFVSSWRFCNRKITVFFNAAAVTISTTLVFTALRVLSLTNEDQLHGRSNNVTDFIIALSAMALVQFVANTALSRIPPLQRSTTP